MTAVVTRFPPSPTGYFHIGSARTALFNYLFAARAGGVMRLRFEDTDRERSKKEYEEDILEGLRWLGIPFELSEPYRQSERLAVYKPYIARLIESGHAYEAEEANDASGRKVVRFKNPNTDITFSDLIRGDLSFNTGDLKDFVIAKNTDEPLYHLAVVIDDHEMNVSHVIRGEDHISNTPRQILILEALGFSRPQYAHIPLILAPDRTKLSKRHGAVSMSEYRAMGFLPEALINYLALLGWNPGGERELYTLDELTRIFSLEQVHKGGAIFDIEKLQWFNHEHIKRLDDAAYILLLEQFMKRPFTTGVVSILKERCRTLKEAADALESDEFSYLTPVPLALEKDLLIKGAKTDSETARKHLEAVLAMLAAFSEKDFTAEKIKEIIFPYATKEGRAGVLWPLRVALSGKEKSPDPFALTGLLGKETTLARVSHAIELLKTL